MGRPCFSIEEARAAFPMFSTGVLSALLSRYRAKGIIQSVHKGFFVVMPAQYALQGRVPDLYYIPQLMEYLNRPYYISLLSAASFWGASHQAVMTTHLMTCLPQSSMSRRKNSTIRWFYRSSVPKEFLVAKNGETAPVLYSNAELTAIDLIHWAIKIGCLSMVATVLDELREATNFEGASSGVFLTADTSDVQRLGYVYDVVLGDTLQGDVIYKEMKKLHSTVRNISLVPGNHERTLRNNARWHIKVNTEIEVDDL